MTHTVFDILSDWKKRQCVLATMHGKEIVIAPLLYTQLGMTVVVPEHFNTDKFGTFTREVKRAGNQLEAARAKALAAMEFTGLDLALASEGSFGVHPGLPFLPSNLELVLLIDKKQDVEIAGHYRSSEVRVESAEVRTPEEAVAIAVAWGFPEQGVIVRLTENDTTNIYKDCANVATVAALSTRLLSGWFVKSIFLETDMRAHRCPARLASIKHATHDLVKNCLRVCPHCSSPGFVISTVIRGLPCRRCARPTDLPLTEVSACQKCHYERQLPAPGEALADPGQCTYCNP